MNKIWEIDCDERHNGIKIKEKDTGIIVCRVNPLPNFVWDARLICKAPEMIELIQELAENLEFHLARTGYCGSGDHWDKKSDNDTYGAHRLLQIARQLINEVTI